MDTGIYYLYEYKNNQKLRNTGFLKLTRQEHACFLQINARCIPVTSSDSLSLSAFYMENDFANASLVSDIPCGNHMISEKIAISENHLPNRYDLNKIDGFFLRFPHGELLVAAAPGINFDTQKISLSTNTNATNTIKPVLPSPESQEPENTAASVSESQTARDTALPSCNSQECQNDALPVSESQESQSAPVEPSVSIRKIQRCELSCLPRCHWNIANNSFLLHGYHNYNHLLLVEKNGHYRLGVPGIYDPREARAAELFGFTQFSDSYNRQLDLTEDECNEFGRFGYWCRYLK